MFDDLNGRIDCFFRIEKQNVLTEYYQQLNNPKIFFSALVFVQRRIASSETACRNIALKSGCYGILITGKYIISLALK